MATITNPNFDSRKRVNQLFMIIAGFYICLVARLVYLQVINGEYSRKTAISERTSEDKRKSVRGPITDSAGRIFAVNSPYFALVADAKFIEDPVATANYLGELTHKDPATLIPMITKKFREVKSKGKVTQEVSNRNILLDARVPVDVEQAIFKAKGGKTPSELEMEAADKKRVLTKQQSDAKKEQNKIIIRHKKLLEGIVLREVPARQYKQSSLAGVVIGTATIGKPKPTASKKGLMPKPVDPDANNDSDRLYGRSGIEQYCDKQLAGKNGLIRAEHDNSGGVIPGTVVNEREVEPGRGVQLTINMDVQAIAETELYKMCDKYKPLRATAIVIDPKTMQVVAMASYPPMTPGEKLTGDIRTNLSLSNAALQPIEPGSTMKPITACIALEDGVVTEKSRFVCHGSMSAGKKNIKCTLHGKWSSLGGHQELSLKGVLEVSCNVASGQIGMLLGPEAFRNGLKKFHFLDKSGIQLPGDAIGSEGGDNPSSYKTAREAFGQSVMVSPLSMAVAYAIIANHGIYVKPTIIKGYTDESGALIETIKPSQAEQIISADTAVKVDGYLRGVITEGTGTAAAVSGYICAGKTGTAQKVDPISHKYGSKHIASFAGYLPASNPRAVIYVMADSPSGEGWGAEVTAPVWQKIASQLMQIWNVPQDNPGTAKARIANK